MMYVVFRHLIGETDRSVDLPNKGSETELMLPIGEIVLSLKSKLAPNKGSESELKLL